jgi:pimeloyl-ACP methyl ester carboxylesterase
MRTSIFLIMIIVIALVEVSAQAVDSGFAWGRDYTFERMTATRVVNDAEDKGTIRLVAYVYRPVKNDRHKVIIFSHGSTGGLARSPKEAMDAPPPQVINYFVSRGYTLVAPMRRGRNESSGTYVEECSAFTGQCTAEQQVPLGERGIREALADTNAVIDQIILGKLTSKDSKLIAGGISRGGFLSLVLAGERPDLIDGVINFVGGWYGVTDKLTEAQNKQRMDDQKMRLQRAASRFKGPTIWAYAVRDPFYKEGVARDLHRYWTDGGGNGEFLYFEDHTMPSGHSVATNPGLWGKQMQVFLTKLDPPK